MLTVVRFGSGASRRRRRRIASTASRNWLASLASRRPIWARALPTQRRSETNIEGSLCSLGDDGVGWSVSIGRSHVL